MIEYINGDAFLGGDDILVQGCNCFCCMGSGFAKQVRKFYPVAYEVDQRTKSGDRGKLGTYTSVTLKNVHVPSKNITIVNAYTQYDYGTDSIKVDYDALQRVMIRIRDDFEGKSIGTVRIGCGLAGGDFNVVEKILNDVFGDRTIKVYVI